MPASQHVVAHRPATFESARAHPTAALAEHAHQRGPLIALAAATSPSPRLEPLSDVASGHGYARHPGTQRVAPRPEPISDAAPGSGYRAHPVQPRQAERRPEPLSDAASTHGYVGHPGTQRIALRSQPISDAATGHGSERIRCSLGRPNTGRNLSQTRRPVMDMQDIQVLNWLPRGCSRFQMLPLDAKSDWIRSSGGHPSGITALESSVTSRTSPARWCASRARCFITNSVCSLTLSPLHPTGSTT